jgi:hypothetical protein
MPSTTIVRLRPVKRMGNLVATPRSCRRRPLDRRVVPDPTAGEWFVAGVAAGLVVVVGALLLLRPALWRSTATVWGRAAGLLLATAAMGLVLVVAVAGAAGARADDTPTGEFAGVLVAVDRGAAGRVAGYTAALLLPLAAILAVLAVAVVDVGRPSSLRAAAGTAAGFVLLVGLRVVTGDAGPAATAAGWAAVLLAGGAALMLALDEVAGGRQSRSSASASDSSMTSSQRSLQSRQR